MQPVDPLVIEWIDSLTTIPAFVRNSSFDILASNRIARALTASFTVGTNTARATFFDPNAKRWLPHWEDVSAQVVALLKDEVKDSGAEDAMRKLVGELSSRSSQFSAAWAASTELVDYATPVVMDHPQVGRLDITFQHLDLPKETDQTLVLAHVIPGSPSEARLFELAALAQTDEDDIS
jgi:hypothetical protein